MKCSVQISDARQNPLLASAEIVSFDELLLFALAYDSCFLIYPTNIINVNVCLDGCLVLFYTNINRWIFDKFITQTVFSQEKNNIIVLIKIFGKNSLKSFQKNSS